MSVTDNELLQRSRSGDSDAFHELVDRHGQSLFRTAYALLRNSADAEDAVQETLAGAYKSAAGFRGESSVKTWLMRILFRQVARIRRSMTHKLSPLDENVSPATPDRLVQSNQKIDVLAMLEKLSPEHQEVLVMREYEQMSYEEMASALNVPRGTIESRLFRARAELKAKLKDYGQDVLR